MLCCLRPPPPPPAAPSPALSPSAGKGFSLLWRHRPTPSLLHQRVRVHTRASAEGIDPFRGKPGTVSFAGVTHQLLERRGLLSGPFEEGKGSLLWPVGPLALIASLVLPQFFLAGVIEYAVADVMFAEILKCLSSEIIFYIGLSTFLSVTDKVQRPYLDFSSKRWSLITGLVGYISSAFFVMGIKVFMPLVSVYLAWPTIGLPAVIAVAPFLISLLVQFTLELKLEKRGSSCWPVLPIIFEVYRLYQLNKGAHFVERIIYSMAQTAAELNKSSLLDKTSAFVPLLIVLQVLGIVCLWSLTSFLIRLFPSRPVVENY